MANWGLVQNQDPTKKNYQMHKKAAIIRYFS